MRVKLEKELYSKLIVGANAEGWRLYRISDQSSGRKPFDIGGCSPHGLAVALEVKRVRQIVYSAPVPVQAFGDHQLAWLDFFLERKAMAMVGLHCMSTGSVILVRWAGPLLPLRLLHTQDLIEDANKFSDWPNW